MPHCTECGLLVLSVQALQIHNTIVHNLSNSAVFRCKENDCFRDFTTWNAFKKHLLFAHSCFLKTPSQERHCRDRSKEPEIGNADYDEPIIDDSAIATHKFWESPSDSMQEQLHDIVLSFCTKLYATPDLPRSYVQLMVESTKELINAMTAIIKSALISTSENRAECNVTITEFTAALDAMSAPFELLATEHRRFNIFKEKGDFILPESYVVGETVEDKLINGRIIKETSPVYAQFIPLRKTLHCFFSLPGVLESVLNYMTDLSEQSGILSNFVQGELWQQKIKHNFSGKTVIPLFIYYDDFEVNNPLGSHAGIQKLGGVYCTIPCLPPEFKSTLENIFLVLLFHADDRKAFGNESIYRILIDEINFLQEYGITLQLKGIDKTIFFALGLFTGDNLGINSAFDFVESFRGTHFCRFCNLSGKEMATDLIERKEKLRRVGEYEKDLEMGLTLSGIKKRSIWNDVNFFHIYENFYVDPLHDLSEGAFKYGMAHVLHYYIFNANKKIPLEVLNERMRTFNYNANNITNKPPLIRYSEIKDKKLSMTGSEMVNFVYIFPLLIGDYVSPDEVWEFYLTLRNIYDIVAAKDIQPGCYIQLANYVTEHHRLYIKLFKDNLKAKHHNMVHYARIMQKSGPIIALSTIRNESKNRQFKQSANSTYSRRNITYTLALKETFRLFFRQLCERGLVSKFEVGPHSLMDQICLEEIANSLPAVEFQINTYINVPW
ncbi:uncharacterized protein LOC112462665, partial [Temnothorax curvispinosus]|uniref:Uncharacterized protein LOC112462665 n=1 Tax=Temnothorax curvispinosus TaxID=300111 RepID=A0A6J1QTS9_9HYME